MSYVSAWNELAYQTSPRSARNPDFTHLMESDYSSRPDPSQTLNFPLKQPSVEHVWAKNLDRVVSEDLIDGDAGHLPCLAKGPFSEKVHVFGFKGLSYVVDFKPVIRHLLQLPLIPQKLT